MTVKTLVVKTNDKVYDRSTMMSSAIKTTSDNSTVLSAVKSPGFFSLDKAAKLFSRKTHEPVNS